MKGSPAPCTLIQEAGQICLCPGMNEDQLLCRACWQFIWMGRGRKHLLHIFPTALGHLWPSGHGLDSSWLGSWPPRQEVLLVEGALNQAVTTLLVPQSLRERESPLADVRVLGVTGECLPGWGKCSAKPREVGAREDTPGPPFLLPKSGRSCGSQAATWVSSVFPQTCLAQGSEVRVPSLYWLFLG